MNKATYSIRNRRGSRFGITRAIHSRNFKVIEAVLVLCAVFIALSVRSEPIKQTSATLKGSSVAVDSTTSKQATVKSKAGSTAETAGAPQLTASTDSTSDACTVLPLTTAVTVLGLSAKSVVATKALESESADTKVSVCSYGNGADSPDAIESIELVARIAKTPVGVSANAVAFGSGKPSGTTAVQGYGQVAFWNPNTGEFNVLNNNNWYTITRSKGGQPLSKAFSSVEPIAQLIVRRL